MAINFEKKIKELENVVKELEKDNNDLDKSMKSFEKGISLYNDLNEILKAAENKVEILNKKSK